MSVVSEVKELVSELAAAGMLKRASAGAGPLTPLFFFCGFALLAMVPPAILKDACLLQYAFILFTFTLTISGLVYFACLIWWRDLLRSESYDLQSQAINLQTQAAPLGSTVGSETIKSESSDSGGESSEQST